MLRAAASWAFGAPDMAVSRVALILGDNVFSGHGLQAVLRDARGREEGATVFGYWVRDPERFGIVEFGPDERAVRIVEKPETPRSDYAVTGLYFYDEHVCEICRDLEPSARGELEITAVNQVYLERDKLHVRRLERGFAWLDAGTPDSLLDAAIYIATVERRQGLKIGCLEEIAWRSGWIGDDALRDLAVSMLAGDYRAYVESLHRLGA